MAKVTNMPRPRRPRHPPSTLSARLQRAASQMEQPTPEPLEEEPDLSAEVAEEDAEWDGILPASMTEVAAPVLSFREVTEADIDRLWDWIRADEDRGAKFLGMQPATSAELRARLQLFGQHLYAIDEGEEPIGLGGFNPVTEHYAQIHLYLAQSARGRLRLLLPQFLQASREKHPRLTLTLLAPDLGAVELFTAFGFQVQHILTLEPPAEEG